MSRDSVLVSAEWAEKNLYTPGVVFVEVDEDTTAYDRGHLPGAIKLDWKKDLQDPVRRDFVNKDQFEALLSARGVSNNDTVILYSSNNNWFAAYAYWYFKLYGHRAVKLLDGGRKKWELESRPLVKHRVSRPATSYTAAHDQDLAIRAFREDVLTAIGSQNLIDVRSPDEYAGRLLAPAHLPQEQAQRAGHIPTAISVPWSTAANEDGTFKSNDELRALYAKAGLDESRDTIAYCRIGERSSHTWFALHELLGQANVKNYDGSWTEYGSLVGVPVSLGDEPGNASAPTRGRRRRGRQPFLALLALLVLLAPVASLFTHMWSETRTLSTTTAAERAAVAYGRPVDKLLAALVDAEHAAVGRTAIDPADIRAAIDEVNAVDRQSPDPLQIQPRWAQLVHEIDNALGQNASGPDAVRAYTTPIALTQALLDRIAEGSQATRDPGPGSYQLTQVALRDLPDVIVNAGRVSSLALVTAAPTKPRLGGDPRLAAAADRFAHASNDVGTRLRAGTDPGANYAVDRNLLIPLDEFVAASDELNQTAAGLDTPGTGARDHIDAASSLVQTKAQALQAAVLRAFDAQLDAHAQEYANQQRGLVAAAVIIAVALAVLLWLWERGALAAEPRPSEGPSRVPAAGTVTWSTARLDRRVRYASPISPTAPTRPTAPRSRASSPS
jgi:thiosulfate/3-mercaptopyruvate sulfurtransferase